MTKNPPITAQAVGVVLLAALSLGCEGEEPAYPGLLEVTNETERAIIAGPYGDPLCLGDELFIDRQLERLQVELRIELQSRIPINIHSAYPVPGCTPGATGCFHRGLINAGWGALPHELVHAAAEEYGDPADFWEEGLAEALSGSRTEKGSDGVADSVGDDNLDFSYRTAGHFVRWLIESRGIEAFLDLYTGQAFNEAYGAALADLEAEFDETAPWSYPPLESCDLPGLTKPGRSFDETVGIGCGDPGGHRFDGYIPNVSTERAFEIEQAGAYQLEAFGGMGVHIFKCQTTVLLEEVDDRMAGDVLSELKTLPPWLLWESGTTHTLILEAGKHRMTIVAGEGLETDTVRVTLAPAE